MSYIEDYKNLKTELIIVSLISAFIFVYFIISISIGFWELGFIFSFLGSLSISLTLFRFALFISEKQDFKKVRENQIKYEVILEKRQKRVIFDKIILFITSIIEILLIVFFMLNVFRPLFSLFASYFLIILIIVFPYLLYDMIITKWRLKRFGQSYISPLKLNWKRIIIKSLIIFPIIVTGIVFVSIFLYDYESPSYLFVRNDFYIFFGICLLAYIPIIWKFLGYVEKRGKKY